MVDWNGLGWRVNEVGTVAVFLFAVDFSDDVIAGSV
jgi:hypothetical protein